MNITMLGAQVVLLAGRMPSTSGLMWTVDLFGEKNNSFVKVQLFMAGRDL